MNYRYVFFLFALLAVAGAAWFAVEYSVVPRPSYFKIITAYLFLIMAVWVNSLIRVRQKQPERFVVFFLGTLVIKLLAHLGFLLVLALSDSSTLFEDVVYFIVLYLIYTLMSISLLYRFVQKKF
ncbi:MAG: hypothetical protein N2044_04360 [Cyclobacteriaceae bacterium]|nr:hypothetical protein [Cyclobacteriaceae bacterium]MCX7637062.1 hypothetical protein [Cyclobacteriaceae bacterium]MDW8331186.1 hypothetical protein [Cyclobacteriaceae bacterium]